MLRKNSLALYVVLICSLFISACSDAVPAEEAAAEPTATAAPAPAADTQSDAAPAPVSGAHTYAIVPAESTVSYIVEEEFFAGALAKYGIDAGFNTVTGTTQEIEGQLQLNLDDLSAALGDNHFTVNLPSLTTDRSIRDDWIRDNGPNLNAYPVAEFTATAIQGAPASYDAGQEVTFQLVGDLAIHEVTKNVTFDVTATLADNTITGVAETNLKLTDFNIEPPSFANTLTVADDFTIRVEFTAREN
ncbi:MAG: YceI family protein [Caldilineaceae bacterium]